MAEETLSIYEEQILEKFKSAPEMGGHKIINKRPVQKTIRSLKEREGKVCWTVWTVTPQDETILAALEGETVRFYNHDRMKRYEVKNFKTSRP